MRLSSQILCEHLLKQALIKQVINPQLIDIQDVTNNSNVVHLNTLFSAIQGKKTDGHQFINQAIVSGAKVILFSHGTYPFPSDILAIQVTDSYFAHAIACELFFNLPMQKLTIAAITGTNGKTTTTFLLKSLVDHLINKPNACGLLSTICVDTGLGKIPSERTTPDAREIQELFAEMVENKCLFAAMEYSSHGLHQHRTGVTPIKVGIFSNLTGDHLDYHKTMENYFEAKKRLFLDYLNSQSTAIINIDDAYGIQLAKEVKCNLITLGQSDDALWSIQRIHSSLAGSRFELKTPHQTYAITMPHIGNHNIYNLVSAIAGAVGLGFELEKVIETLHKFPLPQIPGRLEQIILRNGVRVFIDYAHTDDALEHVLKSLNELTLCKNRVICLFGCGGDRDRTKRPRMGRIAAQYSDVVWLTSDNPRSEDPESIIDDIRSGIPTDTQARILCKTNRKMAIRMALLDARCDDVLLIAGKGHETYQEIKGVKSPFDDRKIVREIATLLGLD